jgi:hypothetical protein
MIPSAQARLFSALAALTLAVGALHANMLTNSDFSQWDSPTRPTGWIVEETTFVLIEQATEPVHSSPYSVKMTRLFSGIGSNNGVRQFVPAQRNQSYTLTAWWHDDNVDVRGGIGITWCRSDSTSLGSPSVVYTDSAIHDWQQLRLTATSPDSEALALVKIYLRCYGFAGNQPNGFAFADDADFDFGGIEESGSPAPGPNRLSVTPTLGRGLPRFEVRLARSAEVRLGLYDLAGNERALLFSGHLDAGQQVLPIVPGRTAALPDGIYFSVLSGTGDSPVVRKLIIEH